MKAKNQCCVLVPMKPLGLVMLCRQRAAWYERVHPETPEASRTVYLPVRMYEDTDGTLGFTVVAKCDKHAVLAQLPLEYVFRWALDVATDGRMH